MPMASFEKGLQQGQQQGLQQGQQRGQRMTIQKQLEARFGPLGPFAQLRLESFSPERLDALAVELLAARSLQELGLED